MSEELGLVGFLVFLFLLVVAIGVGFDLVARIARMTRRRKVIAMLVRMGEPCSPDGACCDVVQMEGVDDGLFVDPLSEDLR